MDTISKDKGRIWDSLQFKFGLSYILIIAGVLMLLNTYPLRVSQDLVFRSKATTLQSSVSVMVYSLSGLDRLTEENVSQAMAVVEETGLSRILVTDSAGKVLYDTRETNDALGEYSFYTEIVQALLGNDVFSSSYRTGPSAAGRPRRCCTRTRSSAPYTHTSMTRSRPLCWRGCRAIYCGSPPASRWWCCVSAACCPGR